jgi:hypothetical protein
MRANADVIRGERFVATLDSRTTLTCAGHDAEVYQVGEGPIPPLHFNCRSVRVPVIRDDLAIPGLRGERAAAGGPVDARTTYNSWLSRQPAEVQDEVLGQARAKLFRGGMHIDKFTDDFGRPLSLDQLRNMERITL